MNVKKKTVRMVSSTGGPVYATHLALDRKGVRHGFFTRQGGVSTGLYDSMNCGLGSDDEISKIKQNRALVSAAIGLDDDHLAGLYQIHSATCLILHDKAQIRQRPQADAWVTRMRGVGLAILTADCLPVLFYDPLAQVIGALHAGWRGALAGIIGNTIAAMQELGAEPAHIIMVIGPGIQQASYQVSAGMREEIIARHAEAMNCFVPDPTTGQDLAKPEKYLFDLPAFVWQCGESAGLAAIHDCSLDTYAQDQLFFSHRRATHEGEPDSGRQIAVITRI